MVNNIRYGHYQEAWRGYERFLMDTIEKNALKSILDVGGGANPILKADFVERLGLDYAILDISESELEKAPKNYTKVVVDAASPDFSLNQKFDLVFSKMFAEHIKNAEQFHKNMLKVLNKGGMAVHFFPTLYTLPFFVNYIVPETISDKLLDIFAPRDRHQYAKFPAHYTWCRGPLSSLIHRYTGMGYDVVEYVGFFGHDYYERIPPVHALHKMKTNFLIKNPNPLFTSYAYLVLRKAD
ncbi:MAG: class I SAM-dependent methyltransferase [Anaerolineales bacterium]|nr:class I SAM-dependent methyltransferase [Anaerolineales bacterium]